MSEMNENKYQIPCGVYEDLLPLVCDGLASEESRLLVEEHEKTCPHCGKEKNQERKEVLQMDLSQDTRILQKIKLQVLAWAFVPLLIGIFYGQSLALSEDMFHNLWIMPLLGGVSTLIYGKNSWKLLLIVVISTFCSHFFPNLFTGEDVTPYGSVIVFLLVYFQAGILFSGIYSVLFLLGQVISGLFIFALRKDKK